MLGLSVIPANGMAIGVLLIFADDAEFMPCCEILPYDIDYSMGSGLRDETAPLMELSPGQEGDLSIP